MLFINFEELAKVDVCNGCKETLHSGRHVVRQDGRTVCGFCLGRAVTEMFEAGRADPLVNLMRDPPRAPAWTREAPKAEGWYWTRSSSAMTHPECAYWNHRAGWYRTVLPEPEPNKHTEHWPVPIPEPPK